MQTLTQRRSVPVDAAKTAAIFGTLLIHASAAGGFAGAPGSFGWTSALFWNCLLRSAVPVFFLCSGALLLPPEKEVTVRRVWTKYIPRILAALLFWAAAYEGVELLRGCSITTPFSFPPPSCGGVRGGAPGPAAGGGGRTGGC